MKYIVNVKNLSCNGFKKPITFDNLDWEEVLEVISFFKKYYDYNCEYEIKKYDMNKIEFIKG